ncbi:MAG: MFS transporter, partial [Alphaproteobacteria bacterium]|nr:MFS transporter [Alphaproteobacteria bacterium]
PIGWFADHYPKRAVMVACGVAVATATALIPLAFGTLWLWPLLTIAGAASAGIYTVALGELGERFSGHELVTGTASFSTTWGTGALAGSLIAGWSIAAMGPDGLPYTLATIFVIFIVTAATSMRRRTA